MVVCCCRCQCRCYRYFVGPNRAKCSYHHIIFTRYTQKYSQPLNCSSTLLSVFPVFLHKFVVVFYCVFAFILHSLFFFIPRVNPMFMAYGPYCIVVVFIHCENTKYTRCDWSRNEEEEGKKVVITELVNANKKKSVVLVGHISPMHTQILIRTNISDSFDIVAPRSSSK